MPANFTTSFVLPLLSAISPPFPDKPEKKQVATTLLVFQQKLKISYRTTILTI
jgi:hypothetical protein